MPPQFIPLHHDSAEVVREELLKGLTDVAESRIEMHLEALCDVLVQWPGGCRSFAQGARIHTENSYKWTVAGFSQLLREAGFAQPQVWTGATTPEQGRFAVLWAGAGA